MIVCCGFVWGLKITEKNDSMKELLESHKKRLESRFEQLRAEMHLLYHIVNQIKTGINASSQQTATGHNLYPDSVPCCGGDSDMRSVQFIPIQKENNQIQNNKELDTKEIINKLSEKDREIVRQTMQELNEFRSTLIEEAFVRLKQKTAELKRRQKPNGLS